MPVIGRGPVRAAAVVWHLPPLVLVVTLLGVAGLLAVVAPSRVTSGVYQVVIGEYADPLVVPTESLTCQRAAGTATCTASVAGQPLTVQIPVTDGVPDVAHSAVCTARHAGRSLRCMAGIADYGHASRSVYIPDGIEVSEAERTRLRNALPWWRVGTWWPVTGLALVLGLAGAAAAAGYLLGGRARPRPGNPLISAAITGTAALLMFALSGLIFTPSQALPSFILQALSSLLILAAPPVAVAVVSLAAWQWQLTSAGTCPRWRYPATAGAATAVYTAVAILVFLIQGAFVD